MVEEGREPHQLRDLLEQWPRRREARARQSKGLPEIGRGQRAAASCQAGLGERPEYDVGERREAVQEERARPDVQDLLDEPAHYLVIATKGPKQYRQHYGEASEAQRVGKKSSRR